MKIKSIFKWILIGFAALVVVVAAWAWLTTYHPADVESVKFECSDKAPVLKPGQKVKVLSWNVQYMAGKNYVFFYDLIDNSGPDERPSSADITTTINEVARVIKSENPDVILLQELDEGAKKTDYENQLKRLLSLLPADYSCHASAFYWKASYVPHPRIRGSVGLKLAVISRFKVTSSTRYQLELIPGDPVTMLFNFRRAVLELRMPVDGGGEFAFLTTHLDAFAQGTNTMEKQASQVKEILDTLSAKKVPWVIGGDFNLLPPGGMYEALPGDQRAYFNPKTEIEPLFKAYKSVPSLAEANGPEVKKWFTHYPNDPAVKAPDRIIDYLFFSNSVTMGAHYVRQNDTLKISDHLPVVAEFAIPGN